MISVEVADPTPPFEQVRRQLAAQIRGGVLATDSRLPSVRQLAGDLALAPGTIARAYSELEADGLVETSRTGTRVRRSQNVSPDLRPAASRFVRAVSFATLEDALLAVRTEWELL